MLLDSNIVIYAAQPQYSALRQLIAANAPSVSAITVVEVLGYHKLAAPDRKTLERFFAAAPVLDITQTIVERAVSLRQQRKISLGDSLVAATALVHGLTLVTHNVTDFRWISSLNLLDPLPAGP